MTEILPYIQAAGIIGGLVFGILGYLHLKGKVQDIHLLVNSRLTELTEVIARSEYAKGLLAGKESLDKPPEKIDNNNKKEE